MEPGSVRAHVLVSGRVQGVFYRVTAAERATELGLAGWVRNTRDGRVEAVVQGPSDAVDAMIRWCHDGPPGGRVDEVSVSWETPVPGLGSFSIAD